MIAFFKNPATTDFALYIIIMSCIVLSIFMLSIFSATVIREHELEHIEMFLLDKGILERTFISNSSNDVIYLFKDSKLEFKKEYKNFKEIQKMKRNN